MMKKLCYKCDICGKEYTDVKDYMKCVKTCGEAEVTRVKEEEDKKLREEINAALNKVKGAKNYYDECLKDFKSKYPEAYALNFGKEDNDIKNNYKNNPPLPNNKNFSKKVEVSAKKENGKEPNVKVKVDGKDVNYKDIINELKTDDFVDYVLNMLGLDLYC